MRNFPVSVIPVAPCVRLSVFYFRLTTMPDKVGDIEVDPRVEWAMKVMDTEGYEFRSEVSQIESLYCNFD